MTASSQRFVLFTPGLHEIGGAARRSTLLAQGLADRGYDVRLITRSATSRRLRVLRHDGVTAVEIPGFGLRVLGAWLYVLLGVPLGLWWGARSVAFASIQLSSTSLLAALCGLAWRRPFVALTSTTGDLSEVKAVESARTRVLRKWLLRRAALLVAQTRDGAWELSALTAPDRIAVLPTPVHLDDPVPLDGLPRAAFLGRLSEEKNLFRLVDAWRSVVGMLPDARLIIAGEPGVYRPVGNELAALIREDSTLHASVAMPGWVEPPASVLGTADVFVLPSTTEGMSNALLEACVLGRVVVASDIPGNRDVLGADYPLLFDPRDTAQLASRLVDALTREDVRQQALEQIRNRLPEFALEHVIQVFLSLLHEAQPSDHDTTHA